MPLILGLTGSATQAATVFTNNDGIEIPATGTFGVANPYPSTINVSGMGSIVSISVLLSGLTHTFPDDLDILLVGPTGASVILMSDVGGNNDITNVSLNFTITAVLSLPNNTQIVSGTYLPTDIGTGDTFSAPAPAGPYGTSLAGFVGTNPNGVWSLYVIDDQVQDVGSLTSWSITIDDGSVVPEPGTWGLMSAGLVGLAWFRRRRIAS